MEATSLKEIYASINPDAKTIYVVPLIRFNIKKSDYLYLLYEDLINGDEYEIKPISVFNHFRLVLGILLNRKKAILHYHWLEFQDLKSLSGMPWKMMCIYLFHKLGGKIVWTLHNEFPHDQNYLDLHHFLHKKMAKWAELLHVHCQTAVHKMKDRLEVSEEKFRLVPHPEFPAYPVERSAALKHLKETYSGSLPADKPILLMFGNISRYKQIERVADLIINSDLECRLMVVGPIKKGNDDLYDELKEKTEQDDRLVLVPEFIPEEHVPWFYSVADICVFHYREILSSGGYHMADAYNKTVIAPDLGCLSEEADQPNVHLFETEDELKKLLYRHINPPEDGR